jgi:hypothetical protein
MHNLDTVSQLSHWMLGLFEVSLAAICQVLFCMLQVTSRDHFTRKSNSCDSFLRSCLLVKMCYTILNTVQYARTNVIGSVISFVIASVHSSIYWNIHSRPTAYSKVTIQHSRWNRRNTIQNQKYKGKNDIKLIYLTYIHCTDKQITELNW